MGAVDRPLHRGVDDEDHGQKQDGRVEHAHRSGDNGIPAADAEAIVGGAEYLPEKIHTDIAGRRGEQVEIAATAGIGPRRQRQRGGQNKKKDRAHGYHLPRLLRNHAPKL